MRGIQAPRTLMIACQQLKFIHTVRRGWEVCRFKAKRRLGGVWKKGYKDLGKVLLRVETNFLRCKAWGARREEIFGR
jgi:hypothetical protein